MGRMRGIGLVGGVAIAVLVLGSCGVGTTGEADLITDDGARLRGEVENTSSVSTSYRFEYGPTDAYGSTTPTDVAFIHDPAVPQPVSAQVKGLAEGTTIHFRLCAYDDAGHGLCGVDRTVTTTSGHDYVTGDGVTVDLGFGFIAGRVDVQSDPDGSNPTGRAGGVPGLRSIHAYDEGEVTCLRVVGNRAAIGYLADPDGSGPPEGEVLVPEMVFVEDNGPTGDRWSGVTALEEPATTCPVPTDEDFPTYNGDPRLSIVTQGDFVVRDLPSP